MHLSGKLADMIIVPHLVPEFLSPELHNAMTHVVWYFFYWHSVIVSTDTIVACVALSGVLLGLAVALVLQLAGVLRFSLGLSPDRRRKVWERQRRARLGLATVVRFRSRRHGLVRQLGTLLGVVG